MSPLKKQLELWHLLAGLAVPVLGGIWQFSAFYTSMGQLKEDVAEMKRDVKELSENVNKLIGATSK